MIEIYRNKGAKQVTIIAPLLSTVIVDRNWDGTKPLGIVPLCGCGRRIKESAERFYCPSCDDTKNITITISVA